MIKIKCKSSEHIHEYNGKIFIQTDGLFLYVDSDYTTIIDFTGNTWNTVVWDAFMLDDIEWIRGT